MFKARNPARRAAAGDESIAVRPPRITSTAPPEDWKTPATGSFLTRRASISFAVTLPSPARPANCPRNAHRFVPPVPGSIAVLPSASFKSNHRERPGRGGRSFAYF